MTDILPNFAGMKSSAVRPVGLSDMEGISFMFSGSSPELVAFGPGMGWSRGARGSVEGGFSAGARLTGVGRSSGAPVGRLL